MRAKVVLLWFFKNEPKKGGQRWQKGQRSTGTTRMWNSDAEESKRTFWKAYWIVVGTNSQCYTPALHETGGDVSNAHGSWFLIFWPRSKRASHTKIGESIVDTECIFRTPSAMNGRHKEMNIILDALSTWLILWTRRLLQRKAILRGNVTHNKKNLHRWLLLYNIIRIISEWCVLKLQPTVGEKVIFFQGSKKWRLFQDR